MDNYAEYVRKSRYDRDYEELSVEETLKRHQTILDALAKKNGYNIVKVYKEVVSGESISQRPMMQQLLSDVGEGMYAGVLVVDIDRLSRGNSIDQGIVGQTFKFSDTKIITPNKTYDPNDEYDEEYFEFSLFMSRKEYKIINRRLERGRKESAKEGKFMGSVAPYGYERIKIKGEKGYTLRINQSEADIVRMMFDLYIHGGLGYNRIANRLNDLNIPTRNGVPWTYPVVREIINNCVYAGLIRVTYKKTIKTLENGVVKKHKTHDRDCPKYKGLHEPIISMEDWEKVSEITKKNNRANIPLKFQSEFHNYYAGVLYCTCGNRMTRVTAGRREPRLLCRNKECDQVSSSFSDVDETVINALKDWLVDYKIKLNNAKKDLTGKAEYNIALKSIDSEIEKAESQLNKAYELLEQEVYTIDTFKKRYAALKEQIDSLSAQRNALSEQESEAKSKAEAKRMIIPKAEHLLKNFDILSAREKNDILKEVLSKIVYSKPKETGVMRIDLYPNF